MAKNNCCLLCGKSPEDGMHIVGKKLIKGELMPYQLCRDCCLTSESSSDDIASSRKKVWDKLESCLLKIKKKSKS